MFDVGIVFSVVLRCILLYYLCEWLSYCFVGTLMKLDLLPYELLRASLLQKGMQRPYGHPMVYIVK